MILGGGVEIPDIPQEAIDTSLRFGERLLLWLEDPAHWFPAIIIVVAIAVWRGNLDDVIRAFRGRRSG